MARDGGRKNKAVLTEGPIGRTLFRLTVPMTAGILAMVAFNLTDTFFVSRLGTEKLAALSFTFPVVVFFTRIAMGLGIGLSSVLSRAIGQGDWREVRRLTTDGLSLSLATVLVFVIAGLLTIDSVFGLLGAKGEILAHVKEYMKIWYWGLLFVVFPMVSNNAIRSTGDMKTPAAVMLIAVAVNLTLDPLLIFGIGPFPEMGLAGAALATVIARMTTFAVTFYIIVKRLKMFTFEKVSPGVIFGSWKRILFIAVPAAATRVIIPFGQGVLTGMISTFGPGAVAALGVAIKVELFVFAIVMALSSVLSPFTGQNWGAGRIDRMKKGISTSNRFVSLYGLGAAALLMLTARPIASLFTADEAVIADIVLYLRIVPAAYFMQGVLRLATEVLNVLGRPIHAAAIGVGQVFILIIPLAWIGRAVYDTTGIFAGIAVAYLLSGIAARWILAGQVRAVEARSAD